MKSVPEGTVLSGEHYRYVFERSVAVHYGGQVVGCLLRHVIPLDLVRDARPIVESSCTSQAGVRRRSAAGFRPIEELIGAKEGNMGALPADGIFPLRMSPWCLRHPDDYLALSPLFIAIEELYAKILPAAFQQQQNVVEAVDIRYRLPEGVVFTTVHTTLDFPTAAHPDSHNLVDSLSAMAVFGNWRNGGLFVQPELEVAYRVEPGDLLLFNPHLLHGSTPYEGHRVCLGGVNK
jgi:hypothetical protein